MSPKMHRLPPTTRLRDTTIMLYNLRLRTTNRNQIARETGLSKTWLFTFGTGRMAAPSVNNVECLFVYLTGRELGL